MTKALTIIAPVYNEEESLPRFKQEMENFMSSASIPVSVLFVNDGSRDGSLDMIKSFAAADNRFKYISLDKNHGLSTAIKAGFDHAETELIGYIDTDLQTSPDDFNALLPFMDQCAMANGVRANRKDTFVKKMSSKIANGFRRMMIKDNIKDTCCPLKVIHSDYAKRIPFFKGMHRFIPALVQLQGGKVKQVDIRHFERFAGTAKYHLFNRMIGPFFDTLAFVWIRKRYIKYGVSQNSKDQKST